MNWILVLSIFFQLTYTQPTVRLRPWKEYFEKDCSPVQTCIYFTVHCKFERRTSAVLFGYMEAYFTNIGEHANKALAEFQLNYDKTNIFECKKKEEYCKGIDEKDVMQEGQQFDKLLKTCKPHVQFLADYKSPGYRPEHSEVKTEAQYRAVGDLLIRESTVKKKALNFCLKQFCEGKKRNSY